MKRARPIAIALGGFAALVVLPWLLFFGATPPCAAARGQVDAELASDPRVHAAIVDTLEAASAPTCFAMAVRLRAGDRSFITVVK